MASLTWWTWIWVNSGSWWWARRPGVLRFMGSLRVGCDWAIELYWNCGGGNKFNGDLLQNIPLVFCHTQSPHSQSRPPPSHASARDSWTPTGKSGTVYCGVIATFSPVLLHKILLCPPRDYFWVLLCSRSSTVGLTMTSSKRTYAIPKSAEPRAPVPAADHRWLVPPHEMLKHSLSQSLGLPGTSCPQRLFESSDHLDGMGFDSKHEFAPTTILLGLLLCPWTWGISSDTQIGYHTQCQG